MSDLISKTFERAPPLDARIHTDRQALDHRSPPVGRPL